MDHFTAPLRQSRDFCTLLCPAWAVRKPGQGSLTLHVSTPGLLLSWASRSFHEYLGASFSVAGLCQLWSWPRNSFQTSQKPETWHTISTVRKQTNKSRGCFAGRHTSGLSQQQSCLPKSKGSDLESGGVGHADGVQGGGLSLEIGMDVYVQPWVTQIASGNLLQDTESPALCPGALYGRRGMGWDGRRAEEEDVCVCVCVCVCIHTYMAGLLCCTTL